VVPCGSTGDPSQPPVEFRVEPKQIRELIELISKSDFSEFELERDDFKIKLVRQRAAAVVAPVVSPGRTEAPGIPAVASAAAEPAAPTAPVDDGLVDFNSPIVGTFYAAPGPDVPPFVEPGSKVKKGQTLCIVEAMKVMNEIESEIDAEVVEIPVTNGQPVEFGEVLFRLRPLN
jgi:acetyl-CoA carboxylase biotin carboxyl carrier protein